MYRLYFRRANAPHGIWVLSAEGTLAQVQAARLRLILGGWQTRTTVVDKDGKETDY